MNLIKNIRNTAKNVLINEAEALRGLSELIDKDFERCVETIIQCHSRVVVTGMGKSAIIANKIVATLNSTGTPSVFMHAADAIHGDLGMVKKEDVVICISKSGNTSEIKVLVPLLKRMGNTIAALIGNRHSYLAEHADFILDATVAEEACPNNLAPTTSTTAALALGDALAVCLVEARGFGKEDFAHLHPGGTLGKQLYLRVSDIYPHNNVPVVRHNVKVDEVIIEMTSNRLGATAVIDDKDNLMGIITDGDLRRMLTSYDEVRGLTAADIMGSNPKTIGPEEYAVNALRLMEDNNITQLIVLKDGYVEGFVHLHDLLKEGIV